MGLFGPPNIDELKKKRDVKRLIGALSYRNDHHIQEQAAWALGDLGDPRAVVPLIAAYRVWSQLGPIYNPSVAFVALGEIGAPAVEPLIATLKDDNSHVRGGAIEALGQIGDTRAVEPLIAMLKDKEWVVLQEAARALGRIGDTRAVEPLIVALNSEDYEFNRSSAAEALGEIGDARAMTPLFIAMLKDKEWFVRLAAAQALGKMGWKPGKDEAGAIYWIAHKNGEECIQIGGPAVEPLIAALKYYDREIRRVAIYALEKIGDPRAVEQFIYALKDEDYTVRCRAVEALGKIGDARAVEPLFAVLEDSRKGTDVVDR